MNKQENAEMNCTTAPFAPWCTVVQVVQPRSIAPSHPTPFRGWCSGASGHGADAGAGRSTWPSTKGNPRNFAGNTNMQENAKRTARGHRLGESNPAAVLTDAQVEQLRTLAEERDDRGRRVWPQEALALKFEVSIWTVRSIEQGRRR